jgi:hypothetical protein
VNWFLDEVATMISTKNGDYASPDDVFAGFTEVARQVNLPVEKVWAVFFSKQVRAVMAYCAGRGEEAESIESRLMDVAAYATLLSAYLETKEPF